MQILRASEDYLETMLMMQQQHGYIRSIDVAEHLGVTKPSVTYATKRLRENGYITMDKDGLITPDGQRYGHRRAYAGPAPHADEIPDGVGHRRRYGGDRCLQDRTRYQSEDL